MSFKVPNAHKKIKIKNLMKKNYKKWYLNQERKNIMYTMSIIGLILFPVALISMFLLSVGGWDLAVLQFALLLCVYAFVYSFVGFVHTVRCRKRK